MTDQSELLALAKECKLPKVMYDTQDFREELQRLADRIRLDDREKPVTDETLGEAVRAYVGAGKRGCGLLDAMREAITAANSVASHQIETKGTGHE